MNQYTCREAFSRLDDFVDRQLAAEEAGLVRQHLELCQMCAEEFEFESEIIRQVRSKVARIQAPPDLLGRISAALSRETPGS